MSGIFIFGAGGQVGKELSFIMKGARCFSHSGQNEIANIEKFEELEKVFSMNPPDIVINAAAYTDVDGCEIKKEIAFNSNALAVGNLTKLCRKYSAKFYHISTDYVFDGKSGNYSESSIPSPVNYYGFSKVLGDYMALSYEKALVIRTSGVYGFKSNFPLFIYNSMKTGKTMKIIKGYYSPIHARMLAKSINYIIEKHSELKGLINIAGVKISRIDLARDISEKFKLPYKDIEEVDSIPALKALRPYDSSLDINKAKTLINFDFYSVENNLKYFEEDINRNQNTQ